MLLESSDLTEKEGREIQKNTIELLTKASVSEPWVSEPEPIKFPSSWVSVSSLLQISTFVSEWAAHSLTHGSLTAHAHDFRNTVQDITVLFKKSRQKQNFYSEMEKIQRSPSRYLQSFLVVWILRCIVDQYAVLTKNCSGIWTEDEIREIRAYYFSMLSEVDNMLGELFRVVPRNTVILFTSDHGDLAMEHQQYYKMSFYEGSIRFVHIFFILKNGVKSSVDCSRTNVQIEQKECIARLSGQKIDQILNLFFRSFLSSQWTSSSRASFWLLIRAFLKFVYLHFWS